MGARQIDCFSRRLFFVHGFLLAALGFSRDVRAQVSRLLRYRPLPRPILIPLDDVTTPWRARSFTAEAVTLPSAANPNQPIRVSGMIVRTSPATDGTSDSPERFAAVCVRCPHELCDVDYVADPRQLAREIVEEIGRTVIEPVYVCPCHNSTFTADGERLAGPAPRGLYRFRVTGVSTAAVEIGEVEEDVLIFVDR
jgi:Rieske Fe-S protein